MLIVVSLVSILAAGVLWLELVIRAALLYVGALLGTVVYAGLVDKNLWGHVRRWAGIMIAVILVKPVIVIVLGLAGALSAEDGPGRLLRRRLRPLHHPARHLRVSAMIYRFVPGFGDEIAGSRNNRLMQGAEGKAAAVISSPASPRRPGHQDPQHPGGQQRRRQAAVRARPAPPTPPPAAWPRTAPVRRRAVAAAGRRRRKRPLRRTPARTTAPVDQPPTQAPAQAPAPAVRTAREVKGVDDRVPRVPSGHAPPYLSDRPRPAERDRSAGTARPARSR